MFFLKSFRAHSQTKSHANRSMCMCVRVREKGVCGFFSPPGVFFSSEARVLRGCGVFDG